MSRELSRINYFLLIRSQLHLPTGISDSLNKNKPQIFMSSQLLYHMPQGITSSGETVTPLLNGNRQKFHLSPKCYLCYYSGNGRGMCRLCPCQPGSAKKLRSSLRAEEIIRGLQPSHKLTTRRSHSWGRDLSFPSFTETSHVTKSLKLILISIFSSFY